MKIDVEAARALPKLTKPQMARLVEIAQTLRNARLDDKPATSAHLVAVGALEIYIARPNAFVSIEAVRPTPLGIRILAGLPGDEFDKFRALIARAEAGDLT